MDRFETKCCKEAIWTWHQNEKWRIRQAAILMASVDSQTARQLLQQMPPATAKAVRKAMVDLGRIDAEEQKAVLAAFRHASNRLKRKLLPPTRGRLSQTPSLATMLAD